MRACGRWRAKVTQVLRNPSDRHYLSPMQRSQVDLLVNPLDYCQRSFAYLIAAEMCRCYVTHFSATLHLLAIRQSSS